MKNLNLQAILQEIFTAILPKYGYKIREEQINLSAKILETITKNRIALTEAEVGIGKTMAYIIPAILAKKASKSEKPIVIATSSIALQNAILEEYIPKISAILVDNGIIESHINAVLRKGKEHYFCKKNFDNYSKRHTNNFYSKLLTSNKNEIDDLDKIQNFNCEIKKEICVSNCEKSCKYSGLCGFQNLQEQMQNTDFDIQICNHNFLLADTIHRSKDYAPLIPDYQILIIDEAHKFLSAGRSMYSFEIEEKMSAEVLQNFYGVDFINQNYKKSALEIARKMHSNYIRIFKSLKKETPEKSYSVSFENDNFRRVQNILNNIEKLQIILCDEIFYRKATKLIDWVSSKFRIAKSQISLQKLCFSTESFTSQKQSQVRKIQMQSIYKAICEVPKIKESAEREHQIKVSNAYRKNPENIVLNAKIPIYETIWNKTNELLNAPLSQNNSQIEFSKIYFSMKEIREKCELLLQAEEYITWLEKSIIDNNSECEKVEYKLCGTPKNLGEILFSEQWNKNIPTVFTSGTLSANGDFSRIKEKLGLNFSEIKVSENVYKSPFNYKENCMLHISKFTENPNAEIHNYIKSISGEIERLVGISNGHAVVLFTAYDVMGRVFSEVKNKINLPIFKLSKSTGNEISLFKKSKNGILFASGALWEGIDIPNDTLSMLIIVKLPFEKPNPISEYEQSKFANFEDFRENVIVPEMLIKLKQGFGRLIRTESDTGVVALLDSRISENENYKNKILSALPNCEIAEDLEDVYDFLREKKSAEYWN